VCEVPLRVTRRQERTLEARFEAGRQIYNALLGEAKKDWRLSDNQYGIQKPRKARTKKSGRLTLRQPGKHTDFPPMPLKRLRIKYGVPHGWVITWTLTSRKN
jgi:hypothetical protein